MALKPDITLIKGDDRSIRFELIGEDGNPVDLTGSTVFFTAKSAFTDEDVAAAISVTVSSFTSEDDDPTNGVVYIPLADTDTDVTAGEYYYDVQVKKADGTIVSIPYRKLKVIDDVTERTT